MTAVQTHPLIADYLSRLDAAAAGLPQQQRAELMAEIREHIDHDIGAAGGADEIAVRNALERLGPPEEIVAAADAGASASPAADQRRRVGVLEIAALIALAVLPLLGWIVGAVLVVLSTAWTSRDKLVGLLLPLAFVVLGALLPLLLSPGSNLGPLEVAFLQLFFLGGPIAALYLAWRLRAAVRT
jgi:uncharacterized membrane protein